MMHARLQHGVTQLMACVHTSGPAMHAISMPACSYSLLTRPISCFLRYFYLQGDLFIMGGTSGEAANLDIVAPVHKDAWAYDGSSWREVCMHLKFIGHFSLLLREAHSDYVIKHGIYGCMCVVLTSIALRAGVAIAAVLGERGSCHGMLGWRAPCSKRRRQP